MAAIEDLVTQVSDPDLRMRLQAAVRAVGLPRLTGGGQEGYDLVE